MKIKISLIYLIMMAFKETCLNRTSSLKGCNLITKSIIRNQIWLDKHIIRVKEAKINSIRNIRIIVY